MSHRSVSSPCSSNPACGFPAPGSQSGSRLRPRKVLGRQPQARKAVVLPAEPLPQPLGCIRIHRRVGGIDLAECEVVCSSGYQPIEAPYELLCWTAFVPWGRLRADPGAYALNARPGRSSVDVPARIRPTIVPADAISEELKRFLGASEASGLLRVDR